MMACISSSLRLEMADRIRSSMKRCLMSTAFIEYCIENANQKVLDFLDQAFVEEASRREARRTANMLATAGFPTMKSLSDYDFSELKMPPSMALGQMLDLSFIDAKQNLIMYGVCGSGKTMLSICLGIKACQQQRKVRFLTLSQLAMRLRTAASEGRLEYCLAGFRNLDLLVIDEWGYCELDKESAGYVFQAISDSYESKSLIVTTNLPFSEWGRIVADKQLAAAIIDRIVHYGHLIDCGSKDWRLASSPMNRQTITSKRKEVI